jgi:hypothetical protein
MKNQLRSAGNVRSPFRLALGSALSALIGLFLTCDAAAAAPTVIELFTSQGCSSCPPADALLGEFSKQPNVIALAYHVDYWDDLGWRDRFALAEAVQRQRGYVQRLSESGAFTPQSVVNGRSSLIGSDRRAIAAAIAGERTTVPVKLSLGDGKLVVDLVSQADRQPYEINVVAYLPEAATPIERGENARRALHEFNIVRAFSRLGVWKGDSSNFFLPLSSLPSDASRVAVLLQQPGQGRIVGAASIAVR